MERLLKICRKASQKFRRFFRAEKKMLEVPVYVFEEGVNWDLVYSVFKREQNEALKFAVQELIGLRQPNKLEYPSLRDVSYKVYDILDLLPSYSKLRRKWNLIIVQLAVSKLDPMTQKGWSRVCGSRPGLDLLMEYFFGVFQYLKEQEIYINPQPGPSGYSKKNIMHYSVPEEHSSSDDE